MRDLPLFREAAPDMPETHARVHAVLRDHRGRAQAIKCADLAEALDVNTRALQKTIRELIHDYGVPVGSAMSEPYGYYLAATPEERAEVADLFHRRALAMLATERRIRQISRDEMIRRLQVDLLEVA